MKPALVARLRMEQAALMQLARDASQTWHIEPISFAVINEPDPPAIEYRIHLAANGIMTIDNETEEPKYGLLHRFRLSIPDTFINVRTGVDPGEDPKIYSESGLWHPQVWDDGLVCTNVYNLSTMLAETTLSILWRIVTYNDYHDDKGVIPGVASQRKAEWCQNFRAAHPHAFPLNQDDVPAVQELMVQQPVVKKRPHFGPRKRV